MLDKPPIPDNELSDDALTSNAKAHKSTSDQPAVVMYKIKHKMLPNYLQDIFVNTQQVHYHNTRQREYNYALPMPNTNAMKKSFGYRGAETWNSLPIELKSQTGLSIFKSKIKQLQIDK